MLSLLSRLNMYIDTFHYLNSTWIDNDPFPLTYDQPQLISTSLFRQELVDFPPTLFLRSSCSLLCIPCHNFTGWITYSFWLRYFNWLFTKKMFSIQQIAFFHAGLDELLQASHWYETLHTFMEHRLYQLCIHIWTTKSEFHEKKSQKVQNMAPLQYVFVYVCQFNQF